MKRFVLFLFALFTCIMAHAETINLSWYVDNQLYQTNTCEIGGNVTPPIAPTKKGYTFKEWRSYIPIEYLESTGTQYIDTGFVPDFETTKIKTSLIFNGNTSVQYCIFGTGTSSEASRFWLVSSNNGRWEAGLGPNYNRLDYIQSNKEISIEYIPKSASKYVVKIDNEEHVVDIVNYGDTLGNIYIYNNNRLDNVNCVRAIIKLYYFQIYNNDVLVRDFIPVLDLSGIPCMYDKVEGKLYYNAGTGQFVAGPVVNE